MKFLFITTGGFKDVNQSGVYTDLLRHLKNCGHKIYVVCQSEKREGLDTVCDIENNINVLRVRTGNITKVGFLEKGVSTIRISHQFSRAIEKYWKNESFDILLYTTPPITLLRTIIKIKRKNELFTYLMLKDIFPQNAIDLKLFPAGFIGFVIERYFRGVERRLYEVSDTIGCMSPGNALYLKKHNSHVAFSKIEICPNTIDPIEAPHFVKSTILNLYRIPENKILLMYGGNIGKPQNVNYIYEVIEKAQVYPQFHFVICGNGTDYHFLEHMSIEGSLNNITILEGLPFSKYQELLSCCSIGLIFLDSRFTIPNFPSRILDYMNCYLPVIAATDSSTDIASIILDAKFGWWCESKESDAFLEILQEIIDIGDGRIEKLHLMGENSRKYMEEHFNTQIASKIITDAYERWRKNHV